MMHYLHYHVVAVQSELPTPFRWPLPPIYGACILALLPHNCNRRRENVLLLLLLLLLLQLLLLLFSGVVFRCFGRAILARQQESRARAPRCPVSEKRVGDTCRRYGARGATESDAVSLVIDESIKVMR